MQKSACALRRVVMLALILYVMAATFAYALLTGGIWPEATGVDVLTKDDLNVDASNASDGYVMARSTNSKKRYKLRVGKDNFTLMYDMLPDSEYEVIPLQLGSGKYKLELFQNVSGNKYAQAGTMSLEAELSDENIAFLSPNPYVPYTQDSEAVRLSEEICGSLSTDEEKLEAVRQYVVNNFEYDFVKASTVTSGTMPSIEYLLENGMGICQDISALVACMLRVQGIPTQFVIGYADKYYHAWNSVLIDGEYRHVDLTAEIGGIPDNVRYTVERFY